MSQNIYDTPGFFENYAKLTRQAKGLDGAPEWARLQSMLPGMKGARVLDLGCGFGWFCRWASEHGAESAHGIDLSQNMLDRAHAMTDGKYEGITYQREDLDALQLPEADDSKYDVIFSSLALHYLVNFKELVEQVYTALKPRGQFVFSVEHPIFMAPSKPGMVTGENGYKYWPLDGYQDEGERVTNWMADGVRKQHRTITTYINLLWKAGFELTGFEEWRPTEEELKANEDWQNEMIKPTFLLMRATKNH